MGKNEDYKKRQKKEKKTLLGLFFAREEQDKAYFPDLKTQWGKMDQNERVKFILGALVGLIIIVGALILVYIALVAIRG